MKKIKEASNIPNQISSIIEELEKRNNRNMGFLALVKDESGNTGYYIVLDDPSQPLTFVIGNDGEIWMQGKIYKSDIETQIRADGYFIVEILYGEEEYLYENNGTGITEFSREIESTESKVKKVQETITIKKPVVVENYILEPGDKFAIVEYGDPGDIEVYVDRSYSEDYKIFDKMVRSTGLNWDEYGEREYTDYMIYEFNKNDYNKFIAPIIPKFNKIASYEAIIEEV